MHKEQMAGTTVVVDGHEEGRPQGREDSWTQVQIITPHVKTENGGEQEQRKHQHTPIHTRNRHKNMGTHMGASFISVFSKCLIPSEGGTLTVVHGKCIF